MTAPDSANAANALGHAKDIEATHGTTVTGKESELDTEIKKASDPETDHQVHLGVDLQPTVTEETGERKLVRKIDWHIMPLLMCTYGLQVWPTPVQANCPHLIPSSQYSDKITLSSAVAFDLKKDTGLVGNDFAWLSTGLYVNFKASTKTTSLLFSSYLAYLIAEFPFGWLMQRFPIQKVLAYVVLGWGICVFGLAACNNFEQRESAQPAMESKSRSSSKDCSYGR